jgi:glutathione peroxidase
VASFHDFRVKTIDGDERSLGDYRGRVCLVVNVASKCGLTPQYAGLQQLFERYQDRGLEVLGFPCNQFAGQEPGTDAEVKSFCETRYSVTFPLFSKVEVNGAGRAPLYAWLTGEATQPDGPGDVKWNFAKFLVDREGRVVARFAPPTPPDAPELVAAVERALGA